MDDSEIAKAVMESKCTDDKSAQSSDDDDAAEQEDRVPMTRQEMLCVVLRKAVEENEANIQMTDKNYNAVLQHFRHCRDIATNNLTAGDEMTSFQFLRQLARNLKQSNEVFLRETALTSKRLKTIEGMVNKLYQDFMKTSTDSSKVRFKNRLFQEISSENSSLHKEEDAGSCDSSNVTTTKPTVQTECINTKSTKDFPIGNVTDKLGIELIKFGTLKKSYNGSGNHSVMQFAGINHNVQVLTSNAAMSLYSIVISFLSFFISLWIAWYIFKIYHQRAKYISYEQTNQNDENYGFTSFFKKKKKKSRSLESCTEESRLND